MAPATLRRCNWEQQKTAGAASRGETRSRSEEAAPGHGGGGGVRRSGGSTGGGSCHGQCHSSRERGPRQHVACVDLRHLHVRMGPAFQHLVATTAAATATGRSNQLRRVSPNTRMRWCGGGEGGAARVERGRSGGPPPPPPPPPHLVRPGRGVRQQHVHCRPGRLQRVRGQRKRLRNERKHHAERAETPGGRTGRRRTAHRPHQAHNASKGGGGRPSGDDVLGKQRSDGAVVGKAPWRGCFWGSSHLTCKVVQNTANGRAGFSNGSRPRRTSLGEYGSQLTSKQSQPVPPIAATASAAVAARA